MASFSLLDRKIWAIAWPAIVSNVSIPALGLVDAAILGHLESPLYLGAVAIGAALLSFLYWGFGFLRMGTTGLVARARGAGDTTRGLQVLAQSALAGLAIAVLIMLLYPAWLSLGLALMQPQGELVAPASSYVGLRILSAPAVLVTYAVTGWFIGCQNTRWPMLIVLLTNGANILLDFWFIVGLGLNSDGAAIATVCAEYLGLLAALLGVYQAGGRLPWQQLRAALVSLEAYAALWHSNRHLFLRTLCLLGCFAFFTAAGDKLGPQVLAANAIMLQFLLFAAFALDGFAYAAEGLSGARLGARDLPGFFTVVRRCALWTMASAAVISLLIGVGRPLLFPLLSDIPAVQAQLAQHGWWLVALPLLAAPSYLLDGVFVGSAETRPMMTTMAASALLVYLPLWYLTRPLGNHGLWLAFTLFNLSRGVLLFAVFRHYSQGHRWLAETAASP